MQIFSQFLDFANFLLAWSQVEANQGGAGVDGETIAQFAQNDRNLKALHHAVLRGTYRPLPLRQLFIPKKLDGWRELRVPTVRDRIVQQALLNILHPVLEPHFEDCSFAYRPGRSHLMAVEQVAKWRDRGYEWILDADIVQFFNEIKHPRLFAEIQERLPEPPFLKLLQAWVTVGVLTPEGIIFPDRGVPQGAVISPILANVYLDDLDKTLTKLGHKVVRFADDFVILARAEPRILQAKQDATQLLTSMGLQLHPDKTQITTFDKGFRFLGHVFAGEVVVRETRREKRSAERGILPSEDLRLVHADPVLHSTQMQRAMVAALKASHHPIPPPLFVALGYKVREHQPVPIQSDETEWKPDMATLYLIQQGTTLKREQERFVIQPPKEAEVEVPIREVQHILIFGNVQLTTTVISTCLEQQIPVIFLTQLGEYKGHLWSSEAADLGVEMAQFERQKQMDFKLAVAREIVQGKLWNSKQLLLRLNRKRQLPEVSAGVEGLDQDREAVSRAENTQTLDQIRGYEGAGAARYFSALNQLIANPGFVLSERVFHPPTDPMNSLLSFAYTQLFNNVFSLLLVEGLNPYLGNLHGAERPKADLAFDLMEEFRSPIADTLVMKLVNQKILSPTDFTFPGREGGVYLEAPARRVFLKHFEQRMSEKISHPDVKEQVSYRRAIQLQVQRYKKAVLGNQPYGTFRRVI
ncbi:CRISPR-associated endonuclease Cas1 [Pantanalinema rosaneae CENA516]|uniref:CRISPR-associated endonuclease Cas1 n=1 Tax=Pantanalinema rosaneae TaxID=1620701 RepID=UPI003D6DECC0